VVHGVDPRLVVVVAVVAALVGAALTAVVFLLVG